MIKIKDVKIDMNDFRFKNVNNTVDLTSAVEYDQYDKPATGGIEVIPEIELSDELNGTFFITQVCQHHSLKIQIQAQLVEYKNNAELKDTLLPSGSSYQFYKIINGKIYDEIGQKEIKVRFWDALHMQLFDHWEKVTYEISFDTWFQYKIDNDKTKNEIIPIMKFTWFMETQCKNDEGDWKFTHQKNSSIQDIRDSIVCFQNEPGKDTSGMKQLLNEVRDFMKLNAKHLTKKPDL